MAGSFMTITIPEEESRGYHNGNGSCMKQSTPAEKIAHLTIPRDDALKPADDTRF